MEAVPLVAFVPYQFNVFVPLAVAVKGTVTAFSQYVTGNVIGINGIGLTVTVAIAVPVQPFDVPVTL